MHSSQTFINIFNFCQWEAETFGYSGNIQMERIPNPPFSVTFLRLLFLQRVGITGGSTKPAVLSRKVCSVLIHVGFSREFWSLPTVPCWVCVRVPSVFPSLHVPNPSHPKSTCPMFHFLFLPAVHTFFSCFFFSMFPWLDCNREEENEVSKTNSSISGSPVSSAWVGLTETFHESRATEGLHKAIGCFSGILLVRFGKEGQ